MAFIDENGGGPGVGYENVSRRLEDPEGLRRRTEASDDTIASHRCTAAASRGGGEMLIDVARREGLPLRQTYRRVAKRAAIKVGRYLHARQ